MSEKGQTLMEVIVAVAVGVLVISALVFATIFSLRNAKFSQNQAQATKLAREGLEKVRSIRDRDELGKVIYYNTNAGVPGYTSKFSDLWTINFSCSSGNCYFNLINSANVLNGVGSTIFEDITGGFKRQILIEDEVSSNEKKVTAVVNFTDATGTHGSRLNTILRKL